MVKKIYKVVSYYCDVWGKSIIQNGSLVVDKEIIVLDTLLDTTIKYENLNALMVDIKLTFESVVNHHEHTQEFKNRCGFYLNLLEDDVEKYGENLNIIDKINVVTEEIDNIEEALGYKKESIITKLLNEIKWEIEDLRNELDWYLEVADIND